MCESGGRLGRARALTCTPCCPSSDNARSGCKERIHGGMMCATCSTTETLCAAAQSMRSRKVASSSALIERSSLSTFERGSRLA